MELEELILEYIKVLVWPVIIIFALVMYHDLIGGLIQKSKVKLSLFGVVIETKISDLEQVLMAPVGGRLTDQQWAMLQKIATRGPITVATEGYKMHMEGDLPWIRPVRNAGLILTLPDGKYIEQAEQITLTPLGELLMKERFSGPPRDR